MIFFYLNSLILGPKFVCLQSNKHDNKKLTYKHFRYYKILSNKMEKYNNYTQLLNIYHIYYKKEYKLPDNVSMFSNENSESELIEFQKDLAYYKTNYYFAKYDEKENKQLLVKHRILYHLHDGSTPLYTSTSIIKLIIESINQNIKIGNINITTEKNR